MYKRQKRQIRDVSFIREAKRKIKLAYGGFFLL